MFLLTHAPPLANMAKQQSLRGSEGAYRLKAPQGQVGAYGLGAYSPGAYNVGACNLGACSLGVYSLAASNLGACNLGSHSLAPPIWGQADRSLAWRSTVWGPTVSRHRFWDRRSKLLSLRKIIEGP